MHRCVLAGLLVLGALGCDARSAPRVDAGAPPLDAAEAPDAWRPPTCMCGSDEVCVEGVCTPLPSGCPCPVESYCDVARDVCVRGCLDDSGCSTGRICDTDTRECRDGCRTDGSCGAGTICVDTSCQPGCRSDEACPPGNICGAELACRPGCRTDADCAGGQICDAASASCREGCRLTGDCPAGMICDATSCRGCRGHAECGGDRVCNPSTMRCTSGCRDDADCPLRERCDPATAMCVAGCTDDSRCGDGEICDGGTCAAGCRDDSGCPLGEWCDGTTCVVGCNGRVDRCPAGNACVQTVMYSSNPRTTRCSRGCFRGTYETPYTCAGGPDWVCQGGRLCRHRCASDSDCASGQHCVPFTNNYGLDGTYCADECFTMGCDAGYSGLSCMCRTDGICYRNDTGAICPLSRYSDL